jgi:hypothetical protein
MEKTLLFVNERAKDSFIKTANESLKFANNLFKESKKLGFDNETAWKVAKIAYEKPSPAELESEVRNIIASLADEIKISGVKLSVKKIAELVELPDISAFNELIEQANEKRTDLSLIPFEQIKRDKNIELSQDWILNKLESFSVYAENERQAKTFQLFKQLVKSVNELVTNKNQKQIFECLEFEGLVRFEGLELVIETHPQSLNKMFSFFGGLKSE